MRHRIFGFIKKKSNIKKELDCKAKFGESYYRLYEI